MKTISIAPLTSKELNLGTLILDKAGNQLTLIQRTCAGDRTADTVNIIIKAVNSHDKLVEALSAVEGYLQEQKLRKNKKSFADQRAGSDAEDLLPIVVEALSAVEGYLQEQKLRKNKKSFADQRAGSDAEDLLPIVAD